MNTNLHVLTELLVFIESYFSEGIIRMKYVQKNHRLLLPAYISTHLTPKNLSTAAFDQTTTFAKKIDFVLMVSRCSSCLCSHFSSF